MLSKIFKSLDEKPIMIFVYFFTLVGGWIGLQYMIEDTTFDIGEYVSGVLIAVVFIFISSLVIGFIYGLITRDMALSMAASFWTGVGAILVMLLMAVVEPMVLTYFFGR